MEKKKLIIILGILAVLVTSVVIYFFIKNNYKNLKSGNNMSNKNLKEIEEYILSIRSYNAKIEVEIQSNKNKNKYVLEQKYAEPNVQKQIVLEPSNIEGLETIFDGNNLKINNTKLNLSTVYENYSDVTSNFLWLNTFTEEYKKMIETGKQNIIEQNGIIIMEIKDADELNKKLYIDRKTGKPIKMQIKNVSKNTTVYILYNEIEINSLKRDDVLAFRLKNVYVNM
jgi:outer membrane lipoprotein-sorting protein